MERQQKIKIIQSIRAGLPVGLALKHSGPTVGFKNQDDPNIYIDGETFTQKEIDMYNSMTDFPIVIFQNASKQYRFDKYGQSVKV